MIIPLLTCTTYIYCRPSKDKKKTTETTRWGNIDSSPKKESGNKK